ncbi:hypothetical protein ONZ43_g5171 [Nemania bipapillata]|uniref:Uncharacterized protein n=1 Tax=Nemania bipapillata TaxID=110536 RepID=A0ACC2IDX9_9PEZI|nr:hypothetical protein ONZ43_g5171 [Nemania bipapillata]
MNTVKSFWAGWGSLCVAGAGAYYFAKKSINADRAQRFEETQRKKRMMESLEHPNQNSTKPSSAPSTAPSGNDTPITTDFAGSPSQEASSDPAPTRHAPTTEGQRVFEKSKYESSTPFKSPKGDRFS